MIKLFLKSIVIGIANIIPGVSGGTVAVLLNVYDDIINKISKFLEVDFKTKVEYFKYLVTVLIGAVVGIVLFAKLITFSITNYPKITSAVFTLLIIPSIPYVVKGLDYKKKKNIISFLSGIIVMVIFIFLDIKYGKETSAGAITYTLTSTGSFARSYLIKLFICGALAAGAMIIPGISGSLLLLMLGEYYNINAFINSIAIVPLIFIALGVAAGLVIFSKIISILLDRYREITLFFITGIITMSIVQIWINI